LLAWCAENRIQIDSRLQIIDSQRHATVTPRYDAKPIAPDEPSREHGLSVFSREESIECSRTRESSSNDPRRSEAPSFDPSLGIADVQMNVSLQRPITLPPFQMGAVDPLITFTSSPILGSRDSVSLCTDLSLGITVVYIPKTAVLSFPCSRALRRTVRKLPFSRLSRR